MKTQLTNERGLATVETIPLLLLFVILLAYSFGSFGVIHTGILNSIAARTYAFETIRNRTSTLYFRDNVHDGLGVQIEHYKKAGNRLHGIMQENETIGLNFGSTERPLRIGFGGIPTDQSRQTASLHNQKIYTDVKNGFQTQVGVSPVWVMTQYGLCMDVRCGGD